MKKNAVGFQRMGFGMKPLYRLFFVAVSAALGLTASTANGQIAVTITGNTNTTPNLSASYTSFANFVTALNGVTAVSGSVTATLAAGSSETAPIKGFNISTSTANVFNTTNTLTIIKAAGSATTINAGVGTSAGPTASSDGMLYLCGMDGVTIDGLTFTDGNTATSTVAMEFGIALFKRSAGDGCNGNTIQNCTFNMQRINNATAAAPMGDGSHAIIVMNSTPSTNTTALTPTNGGTLASNGTNSNNKFYSNAINNGNAGIYLSGYAATVGRGPAPDPATFLGDINNDIGGSSAATGNTILNFGGGASTNPAVGIRANNEWSANISYNTIDNNNGSGVNHTATLRGIYGQAGVSGNVTISNNSVTVRSGGTSAACTAIENVIGSTAASNTVNINNNTIRLSYTTATTGLSAAITNSSSAAAVNINGNNVQGVTSANFSSTGTHVLIGGGSPGGTLSISNDTISNFTMTGASGTVRCITAATPAGLCTISGNLIENISYSTVGSTGNITGIYNLSSATLENFNNNIIRNFSIPTAGTMNGIFNNTLAGTFQCKNNQIYNFSTSAGGAGGFTATGISWSNANVDISGNVIYSINSTGTSGGTGGTITGMSVSGSAPIYNNKVYSLSSASTGAVVTGIYSSGATTNIYNNLIGDLSAPASNTANAVIGMNITGGTTVNAYYNSIYLNSLASTGALFGASGMMVSATPTVTLINNLVRITGTANGASNIVAHRRSSGIASTVPSTYSTSSNNNLFYAGTPGASNLIFIEGTSTFTNSMQTLVAYKTFMGNRDQSSATEDPTFQSTAGSSADFLKFNTTIATQLESGGAVIGGYTTDYAGTTRNASTPDIGAWELDGVAADLTVPSISYSALTSTVCVFAPSLSATITDGSGVNATAGTAPRLYYKKSTDADNYVGNTSADNGWKYVESSSGSSPFSFTLNGSLLQSPMAAGDVIQYFVTAQDNATTPNVGINSGTFAAAPSSVALTSAAFPIGGTVNSYSILSPIATSVTIGAAGTYSSITGAGGLFAAINAGGLSGNTVATIVDASVAEDGSVALNQVAYGCGGSATLTIKPQTTATLTGSVTSGALIKLNGADYVTIDGSNSGGADKSLTIANTATTAPTGIWIASTGTGTGATNNTIKNCIINVNSSLTAVATGISVAGSTINSTGADNDNVSILNNTINSPSIGIYANGSAAVSSGGLDNLSVSGNTLATGASSVNTSVYGIRVGNALSASVAGNTFNLTTSGIGTPVGISFETGVSGSSITANQIQAVATTNTGGYGGRGITVGTGSASSNITIANNFIAGVNGSNFTSFGNSSSVGILIGVLGNSSTLTNTTGGVNIYYNTVNMAGNYDKASACLTTGMYIGSGASALDIRNNILVNSLNNTNASGTASKAFAIYSAAANTAFSNINYNDYYVSGAQGVLGYIGAASKTTLADLTTAFGGNTNSVNTAPIFASATNLHIQGYTTSMPLKYGATPIGAVTTDIDGDARNGSTPDIGADEFAIIPVVAISSASATAASCTAISHVVSATVTPGGTAVASVTLSYTLNGVAQTPISMVNTAGNSWEATIPAATPTNAIVAWTITAVDAIASVTSSGSYQDDFLNGWTASATATPAAVCEGSATSLNMEVSKVAPLSLGSGSSTVGGASSAVTGTPFAQYYEGMRAQYLILASDLNARGIYGGPMTAMSIPVTTKNSTKPYTSYTIKLGHSSASVMTAAFLTDPLTQVYQSSTTLGTGFTTAVGANDFAFGTGAGSASSFTWDGTSNLLVDICFVNDPGPVSAGNYYSNNDYVAANVTAYQSYYMIYADEVNYCGSSSGGNSNSGSKLPNFTFTATSKLTGDSYSWSDGSGTVGTTNPLSQTISASNVYTGTFTKSGCSLADTANVTNVPLTSSNNTVSACDSYTWSATGITYTQSGIYRLVTGCNTDTLNLTIVASTKVSSTQSACDSYTWSVNGTTYTQSGNYTSVTGCDTSILNLTVTASTSNTSAQSACDSYTWSDNGQTYTQSGSYTNVTGCHTEILDLTITVSTSNNSTQSSCDSYTWSVNGQTYTQSGSYTSVSGCHTEILGLTITASTSNSSTQSVCDSYTWSVNGTTYTQSGTYNDVAGCHTETLNLTVTPSTTTTTKHTACFTYTWPENGQTYTSSGTYTNVVGCATSILQLTIKTQ